MRPPMAHLRECGQRVFTPYLVVVACAPSTQLCCVHVHMTELTRARWVQFLRLLSLQLPRIFVEKELIVAMIQVTMTPSVALIQIALPPSMTPPLCNL